jgi:hypothetical protein
MGEKDLAGEGNVRCIRPQYWSVRDRSHEEGNPQNGAQIRIDEEKVGADDQGYGEGCLQKGSHLAKVPT